MQDNYNFGERMIKTTIKWVKYYAIILSSIITNRTVINMFGSTYIVYGNVVQLISK